VAVYRNDATLARIRVLFVIVTLIGLGVGAVGLFRFFVEEGRSSLRGSAAVVLVLIGLGGLYFLRRIARVAVETTGEGMVVRNIASTHRIPWSEVEGLDKEPARRGITQVLVRTSGGKRYPISACGDPGPVCSKIVERLRKEIAAARGR
jgi:hypothetical protein